MAVAFGSSASATKSHGGSTDSLTITKPTGLAVGDLMVSVCGINGSAAGFTSTGWTTLFTANDGTNFGARGLWKIADSADTLATDFSFSLSASSGQDMAGFIARITGSSFAGATNMVSSTDINTSGATNHTFTPGITPLTAAPLLLLGSFVRGTATQSTYAVTNDNPSWTEREDATIITGNDASIAFATGSYTPATATGDFTLVLSVSREAIGFLISINESTNASGTTALLNPNTQFFAMTGSSNTNGTIALLNPNTTLFNVTGSILNPRWSNQARGSKTWTNLQR